MPNPSKVPQEAGSEPWHWDKRVPIALILTIMGQTIAAVWWAASLAAQVTDHTRRVSLLETADARQIEESRKLSETLIRLDARMMAQTEILRRLEESVTRIGNR